MESLSTPPRPNSAPSSNERHQGTQHFAVLVCDIERPIQGETLETLEVSISITYGRWYMYNYIIDHVSVMILQQFPSLTH